MHEKHARIRNATDNPLITTPLPSFYVFSVLLDTMQKRIDCSGKTRLALHLPSSHELESVNIIISVLHCSKAHIL